MRQSEPPRATSSRTYQKPSSTRLNKNQSSKVKMPPRAKDSVKNRRLGAVQTPPPRAAPRPRIEDSYVSSRNRKFCL